MAAELISKEGDEVTIQIKLRLTGTMLEMEESILTGVNSVGTLATEEALKQFDADGSPIQVSDMTLTARSQDEKNYQTPYGVTRVKRYVYQTSAGGRIFVPLEEKARIMQGATPRFAQMLAHKYANLPSPSVIEDLQANHQRSIASSYLQKVGDFVGSIAQAKEEVWTYTTPELKDAAMMSISLDGAYVLTVDDGYREGMVGTVSMYDNDGERLHTIYVAASPEYGKATFLQRLEREITATKKQYPDLYTIGIADGAHGNWEFLKKHTKKQVLDFWHASEYLSRASQALYPGKSQKQERARKEWLEQRCHDLKHKQGAAKRILNELKAVEEPKHLTKTLKEHLESAITYFDNNIQAGRMSYHQLVKANAPIGSGVTEAACKTIVKQRLGGSGMRWKDQGMKIVLSLRTLVKTKGRWEQFWDKLNQFGLPAMA